MARSLRPYPPPLDLSGNIFWGKVFFELQKSYFFIPLLVVTKKDNFFAVSLEI